MYNRDLFKENKDGREGKLKHCSTLFYATLSPHPVCVCVWGGGGGGVGNIVQN